MCEIRVVMDHEGTEEVLMENVTKLNVLESSVSITSLFEGEKEIKDSVVKHIDFLAGTVFLQKST